LRSESTERTSDVRHRGHETPILAFVPSIKRTFTETVVKRRTIIVTATTVRIGVVVCQSRNHRAIGVIKTFALLVHIMSMPIVVVIMPRAAGASHPVLRWRKKK
jgi:hypothetical protein